METEESAPVAVARVSAGGAFDEAEIVTEVRRDGWDRLLEAGIVLALAGVVYAAVAGRAFDPLVRAAGDLEWARFVVRPSILWIFMGTCLLVFRTALWFRYRPHPSASMANAPNLTVVIPAYNEGPMVEKSIESVAAARYPRTRLEILVVDDGSRDDTWSFIGRAAERHPGLVTAVRFPRNRGKRAALEEGFRRARGEVLVTIDSDSVIDAGTLLAMAGPFRNPRVGAVAGKVMVFNRRHGLIPRMLQVRFMLAFDFLRAVQSTYGTVYCCPGALAGYRTAVVREVLDGWVNQRFLGVPCTFGEDRALTNEILGRGYDAVYQRSAVVHTVVPQTYRRLTKMYLRWDRSYVREELRFLREIVWRRPLRARLIALVDSLVTNLRFPVAYATLGLLAALTFLDPWTLLRVFFAIGVMALFYALYFLRSERSWSFVYGVLYAYFAFFALFWIFPYAVITARAQGWLTR